MFVHLSREQRKRRGDWSVSLSPLLLLGDPLRASTFEKQGSGGRVEEKNMSDESGIICGFSFSWGYFISHSLSIGFISLDRYSTLYFFSEQPVSACWRIAMPGKKHG